VNAVAALAILVILAAVVWFVSAPLRGGAEAEELTDTAAREELDAEREAKYREIRDAELDYRTGKLDEADWKLVDRQLRAEAVQILRAIDRLGADEPAPDR
jgi:hypothetical protein